MTHRTRSCTTVGLVSLVLFASSFAACTAETDDGTVIDTTVPPPPSDDDRGGATPPAPTTPPPPSNGGGTSQTSGRFVYVESNDPRPNQNAILAFTRDTNGRLTFHASYPTKGTGEGNPMQTLGPNDHDQEIVLSADRKHLFAVNAGSSSIAVFRIDPSTGALTHVEGSPFPSGGANPVSIGLRGDIATIVNAAHDMREAPSYVTFRLDADGRFVDGPLSRITSSVGATPSQALVSLDQRFVFGADFLGKMAMPPQPPLRSLMLSSEGRLSESAGSPMDIPASPDPKTMPPVALGLAIHPKERLLYVGFPTYSKLGTYAYDDSGRLSLSNVAPNSGKAICWLVTNKAGTRLYTTNSASASVSVYDITKARSPEETQMIVLKDAMLGPPFVDGMGMMQTITSQPFQEALSPDEKNLYVVSQRATTNMSDPLGNVLHTIDVDANGRLAEPAKTIDLGALGVPSSARPHGVVVY